jgi:hypothetical protein
MARRRMSDSNIVALNALCNGDTYSRISGNSLAIGCLLVTINRLCRSSVLGEAATPLTGGPATGFRA